MAAAGKKPLLLVFPFGLLSHYLRSLILCRYLKNYFEIKVANNPAFNSFITQEAFASFECDSLNADCIIKAMKKFDFSWLNTSDLENVFEQQVKTMRDMRPFAALGDHSVTLKMAAEAAGVVYISLVNGYMSKYYDGIREISRMHPAYPFVKLLPESLTRVVTKQGEAAAFRLIHRSFKSLRKKHDLSRQTSYLDEMEGDLTLVCDLPAFFPQTNLPNDYFQLAPLFYTPPCSHEQFFPSPMPGKKIIFVSMGSSGDWEKITFLNHPFFEKYNVIASGDTERVLCAPHISHVSFVDITAVFPLTDLVICHGGNGTIYQSLLYEIPILCYPSHCEQEWNVAVLEKHNLAKSLHGIMHPDTLISITEEWIGRKGSPVFNAYREKISSETDRLPGMVEAVATAIIRKGQQKSRISKETYETLEV